MVCAASENPCTSANFKVGLRNPQCRCNGEFGQRLGLDALHFLTDEAEPVAEVNDGSLDAVASLGSEHEAGGLLFADANAKEVNLQFGLVACDERANLQHVALQRRTAVAGKIEGVVLQERTALGQALLHYPKCAVETSGLPVALCAKTNAFLHQTLRCEAGDLVKTAEVGGGNVGVAKVVEVGGEGGSVFVFEHLTESNFCLSGVANFLPVNLLARLVDLDGVEFLVLLNECVNFLLVNLLVILHKRRNGVIVNVIAKTLLKFYAVAVGNCHVVHVHTEHQAAYIVSVGNTSRYTRPNSDFLLNVLVFPIADNHFASHAHAGADVSELDVAVRRLIEVHEVHVHGVPRNLGVVLSVEVQERLVQLLQALNPHLGGRECVHPGDDADTLGIVVGGAHHVLHFLGGVCCAFVNDFYRDVARLVQAFNHFF